MTKSRKVKTLKLKTITNCNSILYCFMLVLGFFFPLSLFGNWVRTKRPGLIQSQPLPFVASIWPPTQQILTDYNEWMNEHWDKNHTSYQVTLLHFFSHSLLPRCWQANNTKSKLSAELQKKKNHKNQPNNNKNTAHLLNCKCTEHLIWGYFFFYAKKP